MACISANRFPSSKLNAWCDCIDPLCMKNCLLEILFDWNPMILYWAPIHLKQQVIRSTLRVIFLIKRLPVSLWGYCTRIEKCPFMGRWYVIRWKGVYNYLKYVCFQGLLLLGLFVIIFLLGRMFNFLSSHTDASIKVEIGVTSMFFCSFLLHHGDAVIFDFPLAG